MRGFKAVHAVIESLVELLTHHFVDHVVAYEEVGVGIKCDKGDNIIFVMYRIKYEVSPLINALYIFELLE